MHASGFGGLKKIGQISVPVKDLDGAVEFYKQVLGMEYLFQAPKMAFFDCEGIRLLLAVPEGEEFEPSASIIYFKVADIKEVTDSLRERGAPIIGEPELVAEMPDHDLWMSFFHDPAGNTLAAMSEVRRSGSDQSACQLAAPLSTRHYSTAEYAAL